MSNDWTVDDALSTYNIRHWGDGYFDINAAGEVVVHPDGVTGNRAVPLRAIIAAVERQGLRLPTLMRFSGILRNRVRRLRDAFNDVINELEYGGRYTPVFPIKVNQQRRVVEEVISVNERVPGRSVGLEAGSKPELMAVLALLRAGDMVVCNGYKDREYIRLALLGEKLGIRVTIVVEKLTELDLILDEAARMRVRPRIGVRVRLMSVGRGNWQNTGGEKSKFGLSPLQILHLVERCRAAELLDSIELLHFHLGSQVANIQDIKAGLREAARYYVELRQLGVPVRTMDVGGGLSVDYEGTRSRSLFSMNYGLRDYAWHILQTIRDLCDEAGVPHPDVLSESGRAISAHHAVLVTNVSDHERIPELPLEPPQPDAPTIVDELWALHQWLRDGGPDFNVLEAFHDVMNAYQDALGQFIHQKLTLTDRAWCERAYHACCRFLRRRLDPRRRKQRELIDALDEKLAEKLFLNFSVFQSTPDVWGIDQVFPVLPLERLDERPDSRAVIQDITCDSDGRIEKYVDGEGLESTLPLPPWDPDRPYHVGIFLVGAYQEILGDMHNLFGDTDSVDVEIDTDGKVVLGHPIKGDTVSSVLRYVNYNPESLMLKLSARLDQAEMTPEERSGYLAEVREGLDGYTYLE
ncbi:MAG: biosynthetic arginine decarboxylase [Deltaproteobacteria bacterium]|nr:biosynthetic arginine decarboxylase [Deltaproteobacteria bacterium]